MTADMPYPDREMFESEYLPYAYVYWKQAEAAPWEIAALRSEDVFLKDKSVADASALMMDADWWRVGPFASQRDAEAAMGRLRLSGLNVELKWQ